MSGPTHTYGPTCLLYDPDKDAGTRRDYSTSPTPPKVRVQFFYISSFPIDDPLTPLPPPTRNSAASPTKFPPQPFSVRDNIALEEAWQGLRNTIENVVEGSGGDDDQAQDGSQLGEESQSTKRQESDINTLIEDAFEAARGYNTFLTQTENVDLEHSRDVALVLGALREYVTKHENLGHDEEKTMDLMAATLHEIIHCLVAETEAECGDDLKRVIGVIVNRARKLTSVPICSDGQPHGIRQPAELAGPSQLAAPQFSVRKGYPRAASALQGSVDIRSSSMAEISIRPCKTTYNRIQTDGKIFQEDDPPEGDDNEVSNRKRQSVPFQRRSKTAKHTRISSPGGEEEQDAVQSASPAPRASLHPGNANISGSPFVRASVKDPRSRSRSESPSRQGTTARVAQIANMQGHESKRIHSLTSKAASDFADSPTMPSSNQLPECESPKTPTTAKIEPQSVIPVGVSRLHLVELPSLKMKPIYWNPVHDISSVLRATWFYKNSMLPVDPDVANQLEAGYVYMQPWTETWQDELNSCVENGSDAEMKIVHRLWPKEETKGSTRPGTGHNLTGTGPSAVRRSEPLKNKPRNLYFHENQAAGSITTQNGSQRLFKNSSVIYVDYKEAQILRPSLLPSASRGRRPLSSIRKGRQIGIAVVRGFSWEAWDKLHPAMQPTTTARNLIKMHQKDARGTAYQREICYACQLEDTRPKPSDLVLVIHGIGQKLSERVESFHFTHAINAFRRQVNVELNSDSVWPYIRPELESIMVLPINWRSTLSLEDAEVEAPKPEGPATNHFTLKDITPETIPAIRNLISDVMLDIPYYLSHHKQKMIEAVVKEANRVYRLWCANNPGFQENGKVHLLAHSLGSIMVMDILSQQPTKLPPIDFTITNINLAMFEFNTRSVFFCGSPAGFFLLLNKSTLLPRRGRNKPGWNDEDQEGGVAGEVGTYGCLALDNLYNVMHDSDPIAYRLNPAVDCDLSNSLKPVSIPSSSSSFLQTVSSIFRWKPIPTPPPSLPNMSGSNLSQRPAMVTKLPSTIEMETHDFNREELAEKRMSLLNDNGQIDFYLTGGGGPLNIQYLNMLSAHSSYWILQDFIKFLVVEIGRHQGREGTLVTLRAEKKGWKRTKGT